jgi:hypothetical protein
MISEQAIKDRAKQIDPCAFKSYSGSSRREAQQEALARARRELEWDTTGLREQRRYTLNDIDRMRSAIKRLQPFNHLYRPTGLPPVEEQLRTAMLGGVAPQELEDKAAERWAGINARREARHAEAREREADAARVRAGGQAIYSDVDRAVDTARAKAVVEDVPVDSFWKRLITSRIEAVLNSIRRAP